MEPESSLTHSQEPATCPYPEPAGSSPWPPHLTSWWSNLILSSHLRLGLPSGLFPSRFPIKTMYTPLLSPIRATCPVHFIPFTSITRARLGEQYGSLSSSSCSVLQSPAIFSLYRSKYSPQHFRLTSHYCIATMLCTERRYVLLCFSTLQIRNCSVRWWKLFKLRLKIPEISAWDSF
jgi:hypothetical protein